MVGSDEPWLSCDEAWAEQELGKANFGDDRLTKRLLRVAEDCSARPQVPLNHASEDWAATKAAYRLFSNEKITADALFDVHRHRTSQRISGEAVILAVQDTTYLNYQHHNHCEGLGFTSGKNVKGVVLHQTLAVTPSGLPLGLLTHQRILRQEPKYLSDQERKHTPIERKESFCWIEALRETVESAPKSALVVSVCDREADIHEFLAEAEQLQTHYVIRSAKGRIILKHPEPTLVEAVRKSDVAGTLKVLIPSREGVKGRTALVQIQFTKVTIAAPFRPKKTMMQLPPLDTYVVSVKEQNPPTDVSALDWILLTNVPVNTYDDAVERISWYKLRWHIETFHKILKSGCRVEDCRLQKAERLHRYIALMAIVAWRIFWFTHISRIDPEASADTVLATKEREALSLLAGRKKKTRIEILTARQAVIEVAKLGGFLARRHDGYPGPTVIWRGWQRLTDATEMLDVLGSQTCG